MTTAMTKASPLFHFFIIISIPFLLFAEMNSSVLSRKAFSGLHGAKPLPVSDGLCSTYYSTRIIAQVGYKNGYIFHFCFQSFSASCTNFLPYFCALCRISEAKIPESHWGPTVTPSSPRSPVFSPGS